MAFAPAGMRSLWWVESGVETLAVAGAIIKSGLNVISLFGIPLVHVSIANLLEIWATNHAFFGKPASKSERTGGARSSTQV